jgi:hypothetical protein
MGTSTWSGPIKAGTVREGAGANTGTAVLVQTGTVSREASDLVNDLTITLPANAQILDIYADPTVLYDSATSATLSVGYTSGGTEYAGSIDVKTGGRKRMTLTVAEALAMKSIGSNTSVVFTVTSVGQPTVGSLACVVIYKQN